MARTNKGTPCNWALEIIFSVKEKKMYYESVREWTHKYKTDRQHRHTYQMRPSTHRFSRCLKSQQYRSLRVTPQNTETNKNIIKVLTASYCMGCSNFPLPGKAQMSHFQSEERYKIKMASTYLTLYHRKQNPPSQHDPHPHLIPQRLELLLPSKVPKVQPHMSNVYLAN